MRVVQVIDSLRSGGKERQLVELLKGLRAYPDVASTLVIMSNDVHYNEVEQLGAEIHFLKRRSRYDPGMFLELHRLLRKVRPDIVHSWNSMCSFYTGPVAKLCGAKFVDGHIRSARSTMAWNDPTHLHSWLAAPFSDVIVANSAAGLASYGVSGLRGAVIHNGFDQARVANLPPPASIRQKFGITTANVVGMVATFNELKDYNVFLQSAATLTARRDDVTFVAVGDGEQREQFERTYPESRHPRTKFLGLQHNVEAVANIFTIGVLTSTDGEGISNAVMEYMAVGKPVIATDCGGNRDLIIEGETGYLIPTGDAVTLGKRLELLLDDADLCRRLGDNGRLRIQKDFGLETMSSHFVNLYRQLLEAKNSSV